MELELKLRIVLERPPAGVDFGLQKGKGSRYETIQTRRSAAKDLMFEFPVGVHDRGKGEGADFRGPFVQGPRDGRFVYIDIGTYAGQTDSCWSRRLKVPLSGITWKMVERVLGDGRAVLETRVPGTGRDGGPSCATVKPFPGWRVVRR